MRKKLIPIYSVLVVAIVLLAAFIPSCTGEGTQGTITVKATLCGNPWPPQGTGTVNYTLTGPGSTVINGTNVTASFTVDAGTWDCDYVAGGPSGPPDICLESITPASVTVAAGETKIITIEFEYCEDAWIGLPPLPWTVKGVPIQGGPEYYIYENGAECDIIDVHFLQGVHGCDDYLTAVNETSRLMIHCTGYLDLAQQPAPVPAPGVKLYVVNDWCAVNKTVEQPPPGSPEKVSQNTTLFGTYIDKGEYIGLTQCVETWLDVETIWTLVKEVDYLKSINWFGVSVGPFDPGWEHDCVLFELIVPPVPGSYLFTLVADAEVELMDDEDINTPNNKTTTPPLFLTVFVPP